MNLIFSFLLYLFFTNNSLAYSPSGNSTLNCYPIENESFKKVRDNGYFKNERKIRIVKVEEKYYLRILIIPKVIKKSSEFLRKIENVCQDFSKNKKILLPLLVKKRFEGIYIFPKENKIRWMVGRPDIEFSNHFKSCFNYKENIFGDFVTYTGSVKSYCEEGMRTFGRNAKKKPWKYLDVLKENLKGDDLLAELNTDENLKLYKSLSITKVGQVPFGDQSSYENLRKCHIYSSTKVESLLFWKRYNRSYCDWVKDSVELELNENKFKDYLWRHHKFLYFKKIVLKL